MGEHGWYILGEQRVVHYGRLLTYVIKRKISPEAAIPEIDKVLKRYPDSSEALFNKACYCALTNKPIDDVLTLLKKAIEIDRRLIFYARVDDDLVEVRQDPKFKELMDLYK